MSRGLVGHVLRTLPFMLLSLAPAEAAIRVLAVSGPLRLSERVKAIVRQSTTEKFQEAQQRALDALPPEQRETYRKMLESTPPVTVDPRAQAAIAEATHYEIVLENTALDEFVRRLRLEVRYLSTDGAEIGTGSSELPVALRPHSPERVVYHCPDERCIQAAGLDIVAVVPLTVSRYEDRWIRVGERTWHVVDRWQGERRVSIYPFSPGYYDAHPFSSRIFAPGTLSIADPADERFFTLLLTIPASPPYPEHDSRWMMAAGAIVKDGTPVKPGFFSDFFSATRLLNAAATDELQAGTFVTIDHVEPSGKDLGFHVVPVCEPYRDRLNAWIYFRLGKTVIEGHKTETAEGAVRRGLAPVPAAEVAKVCGPMSGIPILHLTSRSREEDLVSILGEPQVRRARGEAEELVYGQMRLRFSRGAFVGLTFRATPID